MRTKQGTQDLEATTAPVDSVPLHFSSVNGRRPQTEARRYVYGVLCAMLAHELTQEARDGWMFGGIEQEPDQRRLTKAIKAVIKECRRRADA